MSEAVRGAEIAGHTIPKWERDSEDYVTAFAVDTGGALPDLDRKRIDPNKLTLPPEEWPSDMSFAPGVGCRFDRKPHEGMTWVCERPWE